MLMQFVLVDMLRKTAIVFQATEDDKKRCGHFQKNSAAVHRTESSVKC
jgi:hypothetical protein